jgi:hypothetical protein
MISFGPFAANMVLALLSLFFKNIGLSILRSMPFKYPLLLVLAVLLVFFTINTEVFNAYRQLVTYTSVLITMLESAVAVQVMFSFSRYWKNKIDYTKDILQLPCFVILAASTIPVYLLV